MARAQDLDCQAFALRMVKNEYIEHTNKERCMMGATEMGWMEMITLIIRWTRSLVMDGG